MRHYLDPPTPYFIRITKISTIDSQSNGLTRNLGPACESHILSAVWLGLLCNRLRSTLTGQCDPAEMEILMPPTHQASVRFPVIHHVLSPDNHAPVEILRAIAICNFSEKMRQRFG